MESGRTLALLTPTLDDLERVVGGIRVEQLSDPTPCRDYTVDQLLGHVVGWLEAFTSAFASDDGTSSTQDAGTPSIPLAEAPARVAAATRQLGESVAHGGADRRLVIASPDGMPAEQLLAMMLGEYLAHGWDLAVATGQAWEPVDEAVEIADSFMRPMVQPEYRGGPHGMFADEVAVTDEASPFERYLGFVGRDPRWTPPA